VLTGEVHLVPLKKILQLHPDFSYLDKAVMGDQKMAKEREGTIIYNDLHDLSTYFTHPLSVGTETEEEEEEARPVQVIMW